jgi:hypothetical protein
MMSVLARMLRSATWLAVAAPTVAASAVGPEHARVATSSVAASTVTASTVVASTVVAFTVATLAVLALAATPSAAMAADKIPRLNGKPDFSGIWQTTSAADFDLEPHSTRKDAPPGAGIVDGGVIPYLPAAREQKQKNFTARSKEDPRLKCWTLGTPRGIYYPEPFQIFQRGEDLTVVFEFGHSVRTIHTNGTEHPTEKNEFWLGDSRGHWDGETLVVDVTDFEDETWLDRAGDFHSTDMHVVERWKLLDPNTIDYQATIEDPKVFSRPWNIEVFLYRHREKNFQLIENYCFTLDYDKYYPVPAQ